MTTQLSDYDPQQAKFMEEEYVILVTPDDIDQGQASKKECNNNPLQTHLMENINKGMLHRAFSVFLFDENNQLLLQKRAAEKITFPNNWTNTCCSHPLAIPKERNGLDGVLVAAQRKLFHELNIQAKDVPLEKFKYLTRIHYKAVSSADPKWGEHEVDYILFIKIPHLEITPNPNEVSDFKWVTIQGLQDMVAQAQRKEIELTPWFDLIQDKFLIPWWHNLQKDALPDADSLVHHL